MNLKSKSGFKKEKCEFKSLMITFIVASSAVMVIHCCIFFLGGGLNYFETSISK